MKLYIKQKVFTIGEEFTVKNEDGQDVFAVEGSFLRIPKMFTIYNANRELMATIENQMFRFLPHYDITLPNQSIVTLRKEFTFFSPSFTLEGTSWYLQGDFFSHDYRVMDGKNPVMQLSKEWFTWGDSYELNIGNKEDAVLALAIAICVDNAIMKAQNNN